MKKLVLILALALGGCGSLPTLNLSNAISLNTIEGVVSAYGVAVSAEIVIKQTPLCKTGTAPSLTNICIRRSTIVRLQAADKIANAAVNQVVAFVKTNPSVDPSQYIGAAQSALTGLQVVINTAKSGG